MDALRQAAQDLLDKIYDLGASPLDWPEHRALDAALAAPEPYDQQALELCQKCGWKAVMPGTPCFVCNLETESQQAAAPAWAATADKMPEPLNKVLAFNGKKQPIRAMWVPAKTLEDSGDGDFGEYDEATDQTYWPEGWYETNAYEETHWLVDGQVTHWMQLPPTPQGSKP